MANEIGQSFNTIKKIQQSYDSTRIINLWFKLRNGDSLVLTDIPELIPMRWQYFLDNWNNIKDNYLQLVTSYVDPSLLSKHIDLFSDFIESQRNSATKNPLNDENNQLRFHAIFDVTEISSLQISYEEQQIIDMRTQEVSSFSRKDFIELRNNLIDQRDTYTDYVGKTDEDYNRINGRQPITALISARNKDLNYLYSMQQSIKVIDFILSNIFTIDTNIIDPFALARQNANNPDINIGQYNSGTLDRLRYGENMQQLASRTLGDPDAWIDIAIANGLKPPYIDEVGEKINLLSNATDNQINIAGIALDGSKNSDKLYVNQLVILQSSTQTAPEQRTIINIKEAPISGELIIELSGEPDLDRYKLIDGANIRIFKPNTINSNYFVLIPSTEPLDNTRTDEVPWFLATSSESDKLQKIDLMLNDSGDIEFTQSQDLALSYGLQNAVQAMSLKMNVQQGELERHPNFGVPDISGTTNVNSTEAINVLVDIIKQNVAADSRFERLENISSSYDGQNTVRIKVVVRLAGTNNLLPISFSVKI